jgi:hypothetical protein
MNQQNEIITATKQSRRECPVCDKTIQIAYSDYCIGCLQELRAIVAMSATTATQMSKGVRC